MFRRFLFRGASPLVLVASLSPPLVPTLVHADQILPDVIVTATKPKPADGNPEIGYARTRASTGTKSDKPYLDTPMAVSTVPHEELQDKQVTSVNEAVRGVAGVQMPTSGYYDNFLIRGFDTGSYSWRNGLPLYGVIGFEDFAFVDHLEIAKGPTAMLYGRVQPGGLVNYVTKAPQDAPAYSIGQSFGSFGNFRTTVDMTGPLNADKTLLYRTIGVFDRGDSFVDYEHRPNWAGLASLIWRPNAAFQTKLDIEHYDEKNTNPGYTSQQIPFIGSSPASVPRNWTQSDPTMWENFPGKINRTLVQLDTTYQINSAWSLEHKVHYNYDDEIQSYLLYQKFTAGTGIMDRRISYNPFTRKDLATSLDLKGQVATGPLKHDLLIGADYYFHDEVTYGYNESGATLDRVPTLNIWAPAYGGINVAGMEALINGSLGNVLYREQKQDLGVYAQDQVSALGDRLQVLFGGRYDIARDANSAVYGSVNAACYPNCDGHFGLAPNERRLSPRLALLYKLTDQISAYASYSESFGSSNATLSFSGAILPPQTGQQYEVGVKGTFLGGRLTTSATLFDLYLQNRTTPDLAHPGFSVAVGETRSRGLEVETAGQLTSNLSAIASYTYDNATITKDNTVGASNTQGKQWAGVPLNSASLWGKYDTAPDQDQGWQFGLGFIANGQRQANNTNTVQLPGYTRVDAMASYRTKVNGIKVTAQVNVQNLFDASYFESSSGTYANYGAPRTLLGSVRADF